MPRAPFDTAADIFTGSGTAFPDTLRFTVAGRLVAIDQISTPRPLAMHCPFYFTYNGLSISVGGLSIGAGSFTYDLTTSDYLEIPPGSGNYFTALQTEIVIPPRAGLVPYRRVHLLEGVF